MKKRPETTEESNTASKTTTKANTGRRTRQKKKQKRTEPSVDKEFPDINKVSYVYILVFIFISCKIYPMCLSV